MSLAGAARRLLSTWMPTMDLSQRESRRVGAPPADSASSAEVEIELWPIATYSISFSSPYHYDDTFRDTNSTNNVIEQPNETFTIYTNSDDYGAKIPPIRTPVRPISRADSFESISTTSSTSSFEDNIASYTGIRNRGRSNTLNSTVPENWNGQPTRRRRRAGSSASRNSSESHSNRTQTDKASETCWREYWV
ncbi:hypothetical protein GGR57DRAFT_314978 [Xylariaceae sp. FL1272]|nr:hypothetical protein GGR57DRAFT_314978 [Xylariaceae sp. FL1272]